MDGGDPGVLEGAQPPYSPADTSSLPYSLPSLKTDLILSVSTPTERRSGTSPQSASLLRTPLTLTDDDDRDIEGDGESMFYSSEPGDHDEECPKPFDGDAIVPEKVSQPAAILTRPLIVPPLCPRPDASEAREAVYQNDGLQAACQQKSSKAMTAVDLRSANRRDSESISCGPPTPTTERLKASHKEEVINFLRQVISSERALRTKVAELKDERESVQVNNYRFEHILRRCVGEQAMELESVKKTMEAEQQKVNEERQQRKLEEWRRQKAESHLARYRQRLMALRQIALSAQGYLAQAEALLTEQTVQDEISHVSTTVVPPDRTSRAIAAAHIQRRRDLWKLRQQQNTHREMYGGKTITGMTAEDLLATSPHECIAQKALEDIEVILDIIRRTFKIEAEMLEGNSAPNGTDAQPRISVELADMKRTGPTSPHASSSTARVYRLLRKIEQEISARSEGFQKQRHPVASLPAETKSHHVSLPPPPLTKASSLPKTVTSLSKGVTPPAAPPISPSTAAVMRHAPPSSFPPPPPSSSSSPPPQSLLTRSLPISSSLRGSPIMRGYCHASAAEWSRQHMREAATTTSHIKYPSHPGGTIVHSRMSCVAFPSHNSTVSTQISRHEAGPMVFKQPPRIMRVGLRRQVAS